MEDRGGFSLASMRDVYVLGIGNEFDLDSNFKALSLSWSGIGPVFLATLFRAQVIKVQS